MLSHRYNSIRFIKFKKKALIRVPVLARKIICFFLSHLKQPTRGKSANKVTSPEVAGVVSGNSKSIKKTRSGSTNGEGALLARAGGQTVARSINNRKAQQRQLNQSLSEGATCQANCDNTMGPNSYCNSFHPY